MPDPEEPIADPNQPFDPYNQLGIVSTPAIPSEGYLQQQVTNPAIAAGAEQTFTPQAPKQDELVVQTPDTKLTPTKTGASTAAAPATATAAQGTASTADAPAPIAAAQITAAQSTAQQGTVDPQSLVREQYAKLMRDVDEGNAPWAAASIRKANEAMMSRGLGQSSMAGAAIAQSVIEAALPIAQLDAAIYGEMNLQNLRNRQEAMISNTAAENAAKHFNAQSTNDVAKFMSELKNSILKFNVEQKNSMESANRAALTNVSLANTSQANTIAMANAERNDVMQQFYAKMNDAAENFNANNALLIQTSNAEWRRSINTANTAGENAVNFTNAQNRFNLSQQAMADLWQRSRDVFNWANQNSQNDKDRAFKLASYSVQRADYLKDLSDAQKHQFEIGLGNIVAGIFDDWGN